MTGEATVERGLAIASESSFSVDPSADGSGYTPIPAEDISDVPNSTQLLDTNFGTNGLVPTASETGPQGGELTFSVPHIGYNTAGGDAGSPDSTDWLDILLLSTFGQAVTHNGAGVSSVPDASGIAFASDLFDAQDLIPVYEADIPAAGHNARTQWALISADNGAGDYDIVPSWQTNPTGSAVKYAARVYRFLRDGGNTFALVYRKGTRLYEFFGCRVSSWEIVHGSGGRIMHRLTVAFDRQNENFSGKDANLPALIAAPTPTTLLSLSSPIWFNGTLYDAGEANVNMGLQISRDPSTAGANGRSDIQVVTAIPTVTFNPIGTDAILNLKGSTGRCLIQYGAGVLSGGTLNASALHLEHMQCTDVVEQDVEGISRYQVTLSMRRKVEFASGVDTVPMQLARA